MSALNDWLKANRSSAGAKAAQMLGGQVKGNTSGLLGKAFAIGSVASILQAQGALGKLKATLKAVLDLTIGWKAIQGGLYLAMRKSILALVHDTGSLEAALKKIQKIQGLERIFAPFLGGAEAAKRKVAELLLLTKHSPFSLDQWGAATRVLLATTRGAFTTQRALINIGDAAARTKNPLEDVAGVVGSFYQQLRDGQPIDAVVEQMRQMGIISDSSAQGLVGLAASGSSVVDMTRELEAALSQNRGGMAGLKDDLESVNDAFLKSKAALAEKFGEPFTDAEIEQVKNYTAAMEAVAPSVGRLGDFFQRFFNVFSTTKSEFVRWIAENATARAALEGLVKVLTVVVSVLSLGAVVWLGKFIALTAQATVATGALSGALRLLAMGTGIGLVVVAVAALVAGLANLADSSSATAEAASREAKAHQQVKQAIDARIAAVRTLTEQQEALAASTDNLIKLLEEQTAAQAAAKEEEEKKKQPSPGEYYSGAGALKAGWNWLKEKAGFFESGSADSQARIAAGRVAAAKRQVEKARNIDPSVLLPGEAEQRLLEIGREQARQLESVTREAAEQAGANPLSVRTEQLRVTKKRASEAQSGVEAAAAVERERHRLEGEFQRLRGEGATPEALNAAEAAKLKAGLSAPKFSSVFAETMAAMQEHALQSQNPSISDAERARHQAMSAGVSGNARTLSYWRSFAAQQKEMEGNLPQLSAQAVSETSDTRGIRREQAVEQMGLARGERSLQAQREGRTDEAVRLSDLDEFQANFEQLRSKFGDFEAAGMAQRMTNLSIDRDQFDLERSGTVDSLQRVAGGGGVTMDPVLTVAQRQAELAMEGNQLLRDIISAVTKDPEQREPDPDFGGF